MKKMALTGLAALALSLSSGVALAAPAMFKAGVLTDNQGRTLYTFDKDIGAPGKSVCNAQCATNWPPFLVVSNDPAQGDWSIITRDDMKKQWAYKKQPLYYWSKDKQPGEQTGDGIGNVWHVIKGR